MKALPLKLLIWPERPSRFDHHGLALILLTLPAGTKRADARQMARTTLRECIASLLHAVHFELVEGVHGPLITGSDIRISLSYAGDKALIGLSCGQALGVDIVKIKGLDVDEIEALARLYLPTNNGTDFALAWAQMEACCKALKLPLSEIDAARQLAYAGCKLVDCEQMDGYRIAVAIKPV